MSYGCCFFKLFLFVYFIYFLVFVVRILIVFFDEKCFFMDENEVCCFFYFVFDEVFWLNLLFEDFWIKMCIVVCGKI